MSNDTPKKILTNRMNGFSTAWRRGSNPAKYAENYDSIFRKKLRVSNEPASLTLEPVTGFDPAAEGTDRTVCHVVQVTGNPGIRVSGEGGEG